MSGGWIIEASEREQLLARFSPRYSRPIAHHVTLPGLKDDDPLPSPASIVIVGRADDGTGVEAYVVDVDGTSDRPRGGTFHITWSLGEGRRAVESNDVIARRGWQRLDGGVVAARPGRW